MANRLATTELISIESNHEMMEQIAGADIIATEHRRTGERVVLWKRPIADVEARGLPTTIYIAAFQIGTDAELKAFRKLIDRIKYSDRPPVT
jgi:hypothetical protein